MKLFSLLKHILTHHLNKDNKSGAFMRFAKWQVSNLLSSYPTVYSFIEKSKLIIEKGMTGATQNIYCGLSDYEDMLFLLHFLRAGDCFIDIGANVGSYTMLASSHVGAKTISIEPVPSTYHKLLENVSINHIARNVLALNIGLGAENGVLNFTNTLDTVNHVAKPDDENVIQVTVDTLDNINIENPPALIKIDVEGFETEVLKGAAQTLLNRSLKAIIIELNGSGNRYGYHEENIHKLLLLHDFMPYSYYPKQRKLYLLPKYGSGNTIYVLDKSFVEERLQTAEKVKIFGQFI